MADETLTIRQGDTKTYTVTVKNADGSAFDLTGYNARFAVKRSYTDTDANALITKTGTVTDEAGGVFTIALTNTDTTVSVGVFIYDFQIDDGSSDVKTIKFGIYKVEQDVTDTSY